MTQQSGPVHRFGPFRYDTAQRLLFRNEDLVPLVPKVVETLHALLEHRGQVVSKSELMALVWPDCVVEEVGLARNISLLRKALGDEAETYIETIPKRGYRFTAAAAGAASQPSEETSGSVPAGTGHRRHLYQTWLTAVAALLALGGVVYWQFYRPSRYLRGGKETASLAVIPVACLSPDLERTAFSAAFTEALVEEISKLTSTHVISPSTVQRYRRLRIPTAVMARLLGLQVIVEGTAQTFDEQLRISLRLTDVHSGKLIWADRYDVAAASMNQTETAVAREVAAQIGRRLSRQ